MRHLFGGALGFSRGWKFGIYRPFSLGELTGEGVKHQEAPLTDLWVSSWVLNESHLPNRFSPTFSSKWLRNPFSKRNRNKICMYPYNTVKWQTSKADRLTQDSCATSLGHVLPKLIALIGSHQKILHYSSWARSFQNCKIWADHFCKETHPNALFWRS